MGNNKSRITYIGRFPPPYGGVTVKNALLYNCLSKRIALEKLDLTAVKSLDFETCRSFARCLLDRKGALVVGLSKKWRRRLTNVLYWINREKMKRSILIVMGGQVAEDAFSIKKINCFKRVFVETDAMRRNLELCGAINVSVYPNCRCRREGMLPELPADKRHIDAVFFSLISKDKGADTVLCAARNLPEINFHFYGRIDEGYREEFLASMGHLPNVKYHGIFNAVSDDVIGELSKYDVHVFPSRWPNEGVPGIIVETKIAGVPTIAADICYNSELIHEGEDGFLMRENTADELARLLGVLRDDPGRLTIMKKRALESSELFYSDRYIGEIVDCLPGLVI